MVKRLSIFFATLVISLTSVYGFGLLKNGEVSALSGSQFEAGNIMSDSIFFDSGAMTATQIQNFLNSKVPVCDTHGSKPYGNTTRKQYSASKGVSTPFICLKNYKANTPERAGLSGICNHITAKSNRTAAQIIDDVSKACGVSQKVLLVLLQKEQSLVTDDWPWPIQYRSATGYGCPDTAPCDSQYYGFFNQVYNAARIYKVYAQNDGPNYHKHQNNYIKWHPNSSCGGSTVYIENQATAGLYNYTPYRPNQAALNNLYGTGNSCSSYGNRNFWRMYSDWFGSTISHYNAQRITGPGSSSTDMQAGSSKVVSVQYINTGTKPWYDIASATGSRRPTVLRATHVDGSASGFNDSFASSTIATRRFATVYHEGEPKTTNTNIVQPGQTVKFDFTIEAPGSLAPGTYRIAYQPVIPGGSGKKRINLNDISIFYITLTP